MRHRFFNFSTAALLAPAMAVVVLWLAGYFRMDVVGVNLNSEWNFQAQNCSGMVAFNLLSRKTGVFWLVGHEVGLPSRAYAYFDYRSRKNEITFIVPHALLVFVFALPLLVRLLLRRRHLDPNRCQHCGYDIHATPDRCPECGMVISIPAQNPRA
jgi:hypothetical protein